jgi:chromosome segregation ATPase
MIQQWKDDCEKLLVTEMHAKRQKNAWEGEAMTAEAKLFSLDKDVEIQNDELKKQQNVSFVLVGLRIELRLQRRRRMALKSEWDNLKQFTAYVEEQIRTCVKQREDLEKKIEDLKRQRDEIPGDKSS